MTWTVIGRGRVGTAMARWLGTSAWRELAAAQAPGGVIVAIPDDALAGWAQALARTRRDWSGWTFLHTSGARSAGVLAPLKRRGAATGSLHPMMTFPKPGRDLDSRGILFTAEGNVDAARRLVRRWGGRLLVLSAEQKSVLHLAATLVGPGAVAGMAAAEAMLRQSGVAGRELAAARQGLLDLLRATAGNMNGETSKAWTGAIARGDRETMRIHRRIAKASSLSKLYAGIVAAGERLL